GVARRTCREGSVPPASPRPLVEPVRPPRPHHPNRTVEPQTTAPGNSPRARPKGRHMALVTAEHVYTLAEADFSDLPVLAVDTDGEIVIFPQCTAVERGARILTDAAILHDYTNGELDDVLAAQFAAEINEALDLTGNGDAEE